MCGVGWGGGGSLNNPRAGFNDLNSQVLCPLLIQVQNKYHYPILQMGKLRLWVGKELAHWPENWSLDLESGHETSSSTDRTQDKMLLGHKQAPERGGRRPWALATRAEQSPEERATKVGGVTSPQGHSTVPCLVSSASSGRRAPGPLRASGELQGRLGVSACEDHLPGRPGELGATLASSRHCHRTRQPPLHLCDSLTVPLGAPKVNMLI